VAPLEQEFQALLARLRTALTWRRCSSCPGLAELHGLVDQFDAEAVVKCVLGGLPGCRMADAGDRRAADAKAGAGWRRRR
jgi:hypothetical protein